MGEAERAAGRMPQAAPVTPQELDEIQGLFDEWPPTAGQRVVLQEVRSAFRDLGAMASARVPRGRYRASMLERLEAAWQAAERGIARGA